MKKTVFMMLLGAAAYSVAGEYIHAPEVKGRIEPPSKEWVEKIEALAPAAPTTATAKPRRILVFSLATGYKHDVRPHMVEVFRVLGEKTGAFEVEANDDISVFDEAYLKQFDAIVLNSVCPDKPDRDLFADVLGTAEQTAQYESNLIRYVENGGGLVVVHGGIAFQNHSMPISRLIGGSFDRHPKRQVITLELVEPDHPLTAAFGGKGLIHEDEAYLFNNAYSEMNFRPLLEVDMSKLDPETLKQPIGEGPRYVAWIRKQGRGRVFFCSPSHQPESYETAAMLRFLLDGTQYALGDLRCDDSPAGIP